MTEWKRNIELEICVLTQGINSLLLIGDLHVGGFSRNSLMVRILLLLYTTLLLCKFCLKHSDRWFTRIECMNYYEKTTDEGYIWSCFEMLHGAHRLEHTEDVGLQGEFL